MKANPKVGDSYRQEYYKEQAEDMADVVALGNGYGSIRYIPGLPQDKGLE